MPSLLRLPSWQRVLSWVLLLWLCAGILPAFGSEPMVSAVETPPPTNFWWELLTSLFNSEKLFNLLRQKEFTILAFVAINLIVFVETGLLIGFCLPGDSLLVTAGVAAYVADWPLALLLLTVSISAIVGDSLGYSIGYKTGPRIFRREESWFFKRDHLLKAQEFYDRHGGKTIILARFVPIVRTFAPVVAGVGKMDYRRFLFYNCMGGIGWVFSMVLIGYFLPPILDPICARLFNNPEFKIQNHIEKVVIVVVFLSIAPGLFVWVKSKFFGKKKENAPQPELATVKND